MSKVIDIKRKNKKRRGNFLLNALIVGVILYIVVIMLVWVVYWNHV